jgi:hypothetical protein
VDKFGSTFLKGGKGGKVYFGSTFSKGGFLKVDWKRI